VDVTTIGDLPVDTAVDALRPDGRAALQRVIDAHLGTTFPALAMTVVHDGTVRLNAAWGWLDPATQQRPTQPGTRFDLASVSKLFTATAFLSLASEGLIDVRDTLGRVVPEFEASGLRPLDGGQDPHTKERLPTPEAVRGQTADPEQVRFLHLLTHTSGLAPWRDVFNAAGPAPPPPDERDPVGREVRWQRALAALCNYPFVGQPGDDVVRYSDLGLMLLGEAVSRLHGTPGQLAVAIRERVTAPLDLRTVTYNPLQHGVDRVAIAPTEFDPHWRKRRVWGEVHDENACGVGGVAGHAGLFGTSRDVAAFGQAWLDCEPALGVNTTLIMPAVTEQVRRGSLRRGLGWMLTSLSDSPAGTRFSADAYGHTGFTGTSLWIDPDRRLVVAVMTNRVYPGRAQPGIHAFRRAVHDTLAKVVDL
jgi:CubicO group peptidase (beta-lactamase class C family)